MNPQRHQPDRRVPPEPGPAANHMRAGADRRYAAAYAGPPVFYADVFADLQCLDELSLLGTFLAPYVHQSDDSRADPVFVLRAFRAVFQGGIATYEEAQRQEALRRSLLEQPPAAIQEAGNHGLLQPDQPGGQQSGLARAMEPTTRAANAFRRYLEPLTNTREDLRDEIVATGRALCEMLQGMRGMSSMDPPLGHRAFLYIARYEEG